MYPSLWYCSEGIAATRLTTGEKRSRDCIALRMRFIDSYGLHRCDAVFSSIGIQYRAWCNLDLSGHKKTAVIGCRKPLRIPGDVSRNLTISWNWIDRSW